MVLKFDDLQAIGAMGAVSGDVVTRCSNRKLGLCVIPSGSGAGGMKNTVGVDMKAGSSNEESAPALGTARERIQRLIASATSTNQQQQASEGDASMTKKDEEGGDEEIHMQESESDSDGNKGSEDNEEDDDDDGFITFS